MNSIASKPVLINRAQALGSRYPASAFALICVVWAATYYLSSLLTWPLDQSPEVSMITRIDLVRLSLEKWPGEDEPFLTAHLRNSSKITAQNVSMGLRNGEVDLQFADSTAQSQAAKTIVSMAPGQELKMPLAPISKFLAVFQSKCPGCFFLGLAKEANMSSEVTVQLCKAMLEKGRTCQLQYGIYPIELSKRFTTLSGDEISGSRTVFVYLSPTSKTEHAVPKN